MAECVQSGKCKALDAKYILKYAEQFGKKVFGETYSKQQKVPCHRELAILYAGFADSIEVVSDEWINEHVNEVVTKEEYYAKAQQCVNDDPAFSTNSLCKIYLSREKCLQQLINVPSINEERRNGYRIALREVLEEYAKHIYAIKDIRLGADFGDYQICELFGIYNTLVKNTHPSDISYPIFSFAKRFFNINSKFSHDEDLQKSDYDKFLALLKDYRNDCKALCSLRTFLSVIKDNYIYIRAKLPSTSVQYFLAEGDSRLSLLDKINELDEIIKHFEQNPSPNISQPHDNLPNGSFERQQTQETQTAQKKTYLQNLSLFSNQQTNSKSDNNKKTMTPVQNK